MTANGSGRLELHHRGAGQRRPQLHRHGDRCGRQYRCGLGSARVTIDTAAPVAPTIASFSTDSGMVGDGITNDNTLTLTGTAEANSTVKVFDGATLLGSATANGSGAWSYTTAALANGGPQPDRDRDRCGRQYRCGLAALSVTIDTTAPGRPDHRLVLDRQRRGRRRHHQ